MSSKLIKDNWNNFSKDTDSQWQRLMRYVGKQEANSILEVFIKVETLHKQSL